MGVKIKLRKLRSNTDYWKSLHNPHVQLSTHMIIATKKEEGPQTCPN